MFARLGVVLIAAIGCGGSGDAVIEIDGAPLIGLIEGERVAVGVAVVGAPASGDCAAPLAADNLIATIDGRDAADLFDVFELVERPGGVTLELEPRCDLIGPQGADVLVELTVGSQSACARPAAARLQISSAPATGCGPRVLAWSGDCSVIPEGAGTSVAIPASPAPDPLCLSFRSRDPSRETLAIRTRTDFPRHVLAAADLPAADGVNEAALFSLPLTDTSNLAGTFAIDYFVFLDEVEAGAIANFSGAVSVTVGDADLAIDVPALPEPIAELSVEPIAVRLWGPGRGGPISLCARASRVDPGIPQQPRTKSFLRLENPLSGGASAGAKFVCGDDFRLSVSPPIDALAVEEVLIEAAFCEGCDGEVTAITEPVTRTMSLETESVVEPASCAGDNSFLVDLACADLSGDGSAELVFASSGGAAPRTCAFAGDGGRLAEVPFAAGSTDVPATMTSLIWRDPVNGPTPVVLGGFASGAATRRLAIDPAGEASWAAATELGLEATAVQLDRTQPLAADLAGGATHLAHIDATGQGIEIACIAPDDPVITGCQTLSLPNLASGAASFRGLVGADLDGDGDLDLVGFGANSAGVAPIGAQVLRLSWPTPDAPQVDESTTVATLLIAGLVESTAVDLPGCATPPCRQIVFALRPGAAHANSVLAHLDLPSGPLDNLVVGAEPTLGPTRGAAAFDGLPLVATAYGVSIPNIAAGGTTWLSADPVLIEEQLFFPPTEQALAYGVDVVDCAGAAIPTYGVATAPGSARLVRRDVDVESF